MKKLKSILLGGMFVFAFLILTGSPAISQGLGGPGAGGETEYKWQQLWCTDGSGGTYEICYMIGDGNPCPTWGITTRDCD